MTETQVVRGDPATQVGRSDRRANLIGGSWVAAADGGTYERRNPANPSDITGAFPDSGQTDMRDAVRAAHRAFPSWAMSSGAQRAAVLAAAAVLAEERAEEIARDMTRETGKPLREARGEASRLATTLRYFAADAWLPRGELYEQTGGTGEVYTVRRPLGVVGLITPWNFPVAIPAWKAAPALVTGNSVVLKPSEDAPASALHFARCLLDAGLPAGVLNVVIGRGPAVGEALVAEPDVRAISFTGSTAVGARVREAATTRGVRVQLELGGHNPLIITDDADLSRAVEAAFAGAFLAAGQKCTATRRIFVQDTVYDEFRDRLLERMDRAVVGDPADLATEIGPLINRRQYDRVLDAIAQARREGATLLSGGGNRGGEGYFVLPTLFEHVGPEAALSHEEVFGPVTSLFRFGTVREAIVAANAVAYGLSAAVFTNSLATAREFINTIRAGVIHVNSATTGAEVYVPFGGIKGSAWGPKEQGRAALEFYTDVATVYVDS